MVYSDIDVNETETNQYTLDNVIEEWPNDTSQDIMEDCVNEELDDNDRV